MFSFILWIHRWILVLLLLLSNVLFLWATVFDVRALISLFIHLFIISFVRSSFIYLECSFPNFSSILRHFHFLSHIFLFLRRSVLLSLAEWLTRWLFISSTRVRIPCPSFDIAIDLIVELDISLGISLVRSFRNLRRPPIRFECLLSNPILLPCYSLMQCILFFLISCRCPLDFYRCF